jgi:FAD/FMN-containing dehydrogenase
MLAEMPYAGIFPPDDPDYQPTAVARTMFVDRIGATEATTIVEQLAASDAPLRAAQLRVHGGAIARVPVEATAFAHRGSEILVNVAAFYEGEDDRRRRQAWVDGLAAALRQSDAGAYVNFVGDEGEAGVRAAYPDATLQRLREVKARYDPHNLFRRNQNIPPA